MNKIAQIKRLRALCEEIGLSVRLLDCKDFVDKYHVDNHVLVNHLRHEMASHVSVEVQDFMLGLQEKISDQFYLTGSRFFGGFHPFSDTDFFIQQGLETRNVLYQNGFTIVRTMRPYLDKDCADVFAHQRFGIHVQLSRDVTKRLRGRNLLKASVSNVASMKKSDRSYVWNTFF
jgi:hypothetical protein